MNVDKMRKNLYRHAPDNSEIDIDPHADDADEKVQKFFIDFSRKMRGKHGKNLKSIATYETGNFENHIRRIQAVAELW